MNNDDFTLDDLLDDDADNFRGIELDTAKAARLDTMKKACEHIRELNSSVEYPPPLFLNTERHAGVRLIYPAMNFLQNTREMKLLAELFTSADAVFMSVGEDGRIYLSFDVQNIWTKWEEN